MPDLTLFIHPDALATSTDLPTNQLERLRAPLSRQDDNLVRAYAYEESL